MVRQLPPWFENLGKRQVKSDLKLDRLLVVYPGLHRYQIAPRVEAVPLAELVGFSPAEDPFKRRH